MISFVDVISSPLSETLPHKGTPRWGAIHIMHEVPCTNLLSVFLSPPAPSDRSPYRYERAAARAAPPIRSTERDHVNKSRCLNSRSARSERQRWKPHWVGSNNGRLSGSGVQVNFFFFPPWLCTFSALAPSRRLCWDGGLCGSDAGLWDRMFGIQFAVSCRWFSALLRSADRTNSIIGLVALHRLRIETPPPRSSLPPSLSLSRPPVSRRHMRLLIVDRSLVIPDWAGWAATAICETRMLIELYFASRFVVIGRAHIDWRRAEREASFGAACNQASGGKLLLLNYL